MNNMLKSSSISPYLEYIKSRRIVGSCIKLYAFFLVSIFDKDSEAINQI